MNAQLKEAHYAELLTARSLTSNLLANAKKWRDITRMDGGQEYDWSNQRVQDLDLQLREDNARMRAALSQDLKDRYAAEREAARRESAECMGASNGSVDWSNV